MSTPLIELNGIRKTFKVAERSAGTLAAAKALLHRKHRLVEALNDISFTIQEGEIVGYIGPNGAGKSTTIKIMCGILVPDGGSCKILNRTPWKERTAYVGQIGVVFGQRSQLWWDVPVLDSFELLRDIYRIPEARYRSNLSMLTETLSLEELLRVPVRQLSLGQRMRCEIAASLLHDPKILFLDEPTIGLDAASKIAVRQFIKTINRDKGVTVILTTHDMNDIEALADRILMIGKGSLLYDGSLQELRRRYGSRRTVTVDFLESRQQPQIPLASLHSWTPEQAVFSYDSGQLSLAELIAAVSETAEVRDVSVESASVDELILQLYREHRI
ncbi:MULTISPECIES: ATP-binding cassette domain-containing protein [Paenibacillus]|uniref:ABC transporter ATP-binding protein n=1 Tax=Paenibacillus TaxID=44249 RepID=UPI001F388047|nr:MULTISPECIES: ATP-binding cassette domain-containing protein [Paenibacillus]